MKKQIVLVKWWNSSENFKDYYDFLEKEEYTPYKEVSKKWNRNLWKVLWEDYEVLIHESFNNNFADYKSWKIMFEKMIPFLNSEVIFIGHSMWWVFLAKYFEEEGNLELQKKAKKILLIAPPFKDDKREVIWSFNFKNTKLSNLLKIQNKIVIFGSEDDFIVNFSDIEDYMEALPKASYNIFKNKWHFLQEEFIELIEEINSI